MSQVQGQAWRSVAAAALLTLGLAAAGGASAQTTVSGELTAADPLWDRNAAFAAPPCTPGAETYRYDAYPISHAGGTLTIEMRGASTGSGTLGDPYVYLYNGPFNSASPCTNHLANNDDGGTGLDSLLSGPYPAGNYVIVATGWNSGALGTYRLIHSASPVSAAAPTPVPTLGEWSLMALSLALAGGAAGALRRRRRA